jgi:hypothetical protein
MASSSKVHIPFPEKYSFEYARKLFAPIRRKECVTTIWVATAGRRVLNRFIVDNINLFEKQLPDHQEFLLVYVEPIDLTEESQVGYLRLIGSTFIEACQKRKDIKVEFSQEELEVFEDEKTAYAKTLQVLKRIIAKVIDLNIEVVLFLGEIDELTFINTIFCNNLRSIWNRFDGKLHYIFLIKDVRLIFAKDYFGEELGSLFFQNLLYVPVSADNQDYLVKFFEKKTGYQLTAEKRKVISEMCDGHPYFLKLSIENLAKEDLPESPLPVEKIGDVLRANHEIRAVSRRMIEVQADKARKALVELATKKVENLSGEQLKTLISLGLVFKNNQGFYQPFCRLFHDAIIKRSMPTSSLAGSQDGLVFDSKLNSIVFAGKPVEDKFTRQEYELLSFFLKEPNKVHSRDRIAEAIWGKESYEKYSDWAIDQLMSKLRKKLKDLGVDRKVLTTIRGRGYKLTRD